MLTFTTQVIAELLQPTINYVPIVRWDLGSTVLYFSTHNLDPSDTFDGRAYAARLLAKGVDKLPIPIGKESSKAKTKIGFANADGYISDLRDVDGHEFRNSRISICLHFPGIAPPNNRVGDWGPDDASGAPNSDGPFWNGRVLKPDTDADAIFEVGFGFVELAHRAWRRFQTSCNCVFGEPSTGCKMDIVGGWGLPERTSTGTATGGSATTLVDSGADFVADGLVAGDFAQAYLPGDPSQLVVGEIQSVAPTTVTVVGNWSFGAAPAAGWNYRMGPKPTTCGHLVPDCQDHGNFGVSPSTPAESLNYNRLRLFQGIGPIAPTKVQGVNRSGSGPKHFDTLPAGNDSLENKVIPVPFGTILLDDLPIIAGVNDGDYIYAFVAVGQGRCQSLLSASLGDLPPDNHDFRNEVYRDTLQTFCFDGQADDSSHVGAFSLTEFERREGIGAREVYAHSVRQVLDQYEHVPYLMASAAGLGPSWSTLSAFFIRVEIKGTQVSGAPKAKALILGRGTRTIGNGGFEDNPSIPEVIWETIQNQIWGAGLDVKHLHQAGFQAAHDALPGLFPGGAAPVVPTQDFPVVFGPFDAVTPPNPDGSNWVFLDTPLDLTPYIGHDLEVTTIGKEQTHEISDVYQVDSTQQTINDPSLGGPFEIGDSDQGLFGSFVRISGDWDNGKVPAAGDTVRLKPASSVSLRANGQPARDVDWNQAISDMMVNIEGDHYQRHGQITIAIRNAANLTEVNAAPTITDRGSSRNVIPGTVKWNATEVGKLPTELRVSFLDRAQNYKKVTFVVRDDLLQNRYRDVYGEDARDQAEASVDYNLLTSLEEIMVMSALHMRHFGARPGTLENGFVSFLMPIHDALGLRPIEDVRNCDFGAAGDGKPRPVPTWITRIRIDKGMEINLQSGNVQVKAIPYVHSDYTAPVSGFTFDLPAGSERAAELLAPDPTSIDSITEELVTDPFGLTLTILRVKYTLPGDET